MKTAVRIVLTLGISGVCVFAAKSDRALAQSNIVPDGTLGTESSTVIQNFNGLAVEAIDGGAIRGANLFHSFQEFNVSEGRGAYFFSPTATIQNILTRVTGNNPSEILGTLGTFGQSNPNLFLINPNGIIFGPNARLDVGGSFVASTASAITFPNGIKFSATNPQAPPLLTVSVPLGLQYGSNAGSIAVQRSFLQVPDGQTLALVGGNVSLDGAILAAVGGRVELGAVAGTGTVELNSNGSNLSSSFPQGLALVDISLTNGAIGFVAAGGGGSIGINAFDLTMARGSGLFAGIGPGLGAADSIAGNIDINATGAINLTDGSMIGNSVSEGARGKGGDINITTGKLLVRDGSSIAAFTIGEGKVGNLTVNASQEVQLLGGYLSTSVNQESSGKAGDITINTGTLLVRDRALVSTRTDGEEDGGNLTVNASQSVQLQGRGMATLASEGASGKTGDLMINTGTLLLSDGAKVNTSSLGESNVGNLTVNASDSVQLIGDGSGLFAIAFSASKGQAGDLTINTGTLLVRDGAVVSTNTSGGSNGGSVTVRASDSVQLIGTSADGQVSSSLTSDAFGTGAAGNVSITTGRFIATGGAQASTSTYGAGRGGELTVNASEFVELIGSGLLPSGLYTNSGTTSTGDSGNLIVNTPVLLVRNGAVVNASTFGEGKGGNLTVNASDLVQLVGESANGQFSSSLASEAFGTGAAGNVSITTGRFIATGGAYASSSTYSAGRGGQLTVNASKFVELIGRGRFSSGLYTQAGTGTGDSGNLTVNTPVLLVRDGATVNASTAGAGKGGNLTVNASQEVQLLGESADGLSASSLTGEAFGTGAAGNVSITTGRFIATGGAYASTYTYRAGQGGEVTVNASEFVKLIGSGRFSSGVYAGTAGTGDSGNLIVNTPALLVRDGATLYTNTSSEGDAGDLTINTGALIAQDGGFVSASTFGAGNGGNLTVNASELVQVSGTSADGQFPSGVFAAATSESSGKAGDVTINTGSLLVRDGAFISARTQSSGNGGSLTVKASDSVQLSGTGSGLLVNAIAGSTAGNLTVETKQMSVSDGAQVTVSSSQGQAGNMTIQANSLQLNQGRLFAETAKSGESGANITLTGLDLLRMDNESLISANALDEANGGNVTINSTFIVATPPTGSQGSDITANAVRGNGGRVRITTQGLFGIEFREKRTPQNDITVSSDFGLAGVFEQNTPTVDPRQGLIQLPTDIVDATKLIDRRCTPEQATSRSRFVITGRGGLPASPNEMLQGEAVITNWVTLDSEAQNMNSDVSNVNPTTTTSQKEAEERGSREAREQELVPSVTAAKRSWNAPKQLVEAQGWIIAPDGKVILTPTAPSATPYGTWQPPVKCG